MLSLAVIALAGSAAAQFSLPTVGAGIGQTAISAQLFETLRLYGQFAAAAYADNCGIPPNGSTVLKYFNNAQTDTQGTLFSYPTGRQIVLSMRGTSAPYDINSDFNFLPQGVSIQGAPSGCNACQVHGGFQEAWQSVQSDVISSTNAALSANPGYTLVVTGHSLGAALASFASVALSTKSPTVYTYGEPRNGNQQFSAYVDGIISPSKYFRVTHANDGVPQIPPSIIGFNHHGTEYWQSQPLYANSASTTYNCGTGDPQACNLGQGFGDSPINAAHVSYNNFVIGNSLFIAACGAKWP